MGRLLAGVGVCAIVSLNTGLLLFTPVGGIPLQSIGLFWDKVLGVVSLIFWAAGVFGASVLACRVAGKLEGLVSLGAVASSMVALVGFPFAFLENIPAAYLQLGSIILVVPLLFIFYAGAMISFFARRPDMI